MSNNNPENKPRITRRQFLATGGVGAAAIVAGAIIGSELRRSAATAPSVAASGITPPPDNTPAPTVAPAVLTLAPRPTDAATAAAVPTVEQSATNVPAKATTVSPTAVPATEADVPTIIPTPKAENSPKTEMVLKDWNTYGPGDLIDAITNQKAGLLTGAGLPGVNPTDSHRFFAYFGENDGTIEPDLFTQEPTGSDSFEGRYAIKGATEIKLKGHLEGSFLVGEISDRWHKSYKFKLPFKGTGLTSLLRLSETTKQYALEELAGHPLNGGPIPDSMMLDDINRELQKTFKSSLPPYTPS